MQSGSACYDADAVKRGQHFIHSPFIAKIDTAIHQVVCQDPLQSLRLLVDLFFHIISIALLAGVSCIPVNDLHFRLHFLSIEINNRNLRLGRL